MSSGFQPPRPFTRTGDVPRIRTLGTLMIWQGALTLLWFLFCLLGMAVGALNAFVGSASTLESWGIGVAYLLFAVGALASAVPMILAGIRVRLVRGRRLASGGARVSGERGRLEVGSRIRTVGSGTRHTGRVVEVGPDRCEVVWDGGQHRTCVEPSVIEIDPGSPGAHPPGTRVLAEAPDGKRQPATVRWFNGARYEIEWDAGGTAWLGPGQLTRVT